MSSKSLDKLHQGNLTPAVSYLKITLIFVIVAVLIGSIVVGIIVYRDSQRKKEAVEEMEVASSFVPDTYYPTFTAKDINERKNSESQVTETVVVDMSKGNKALQQPQSEEEKKAEIEAQLAAEKEAEKQKKLTAEEAFLREQMDLAQTLLAMRRDQLLSRRGKPASDWGVVEVIPEIKSQNKELTTPTDKDFSSQKIGKDTSTFPVDLSRTVTANRHIPCILVDQINSQLEGRAVCTVERNVFGYHGRNILIPAGSKFMGSHSTLKKVGDERFNIHWTRLLRPDGVHVSLTDAYASDTIGGTGIEGEVNRRNWEKYGGALLTSTISVLAQMSIPSEGTNISNSVFESFSTDMGRVTAAMLNENINIKPYSIVPAGTRILVTPVTDIWLKNTDEQLSFQAIQEGKQ